MTMVGHIAGYVLPTLLGVSILVLLARGRRQFGVFEATALGFALGTGLLTFYMFFLGLLGVRYTLFVCTAPIWPLLIWAALVTRRHGWCVGHEGPPLWAGRSWPARLGLALLVLILVWKVAMSAFTAAVGPTYFDDSVSIWNYKAKVFYEHGGLVLDRSHPDFFGGHTPKYPNGIPLFKAWLALCRGGWQEEGVNVVNVVVYLCIGILLFHNVRLRAPPWLALVVAYVGMSVPLLAFHAGFGYVDMIVGFYLMGGMIYLCRWVEREQVSCVVVAALLFATAGWVKDEALYLFVGGVVPALVAVGLAHRSLRRRLLIGAALLTGAVLLLLGPWLVCKLIFDFPVAVVGEEYYRLEWHPEAFGIMAHQLFSMGNFNIFWIVYLVILAVSPVVMRGSGTAFLVVSNVLLLCLAWGPFFFTPLFKWLPGGSTSLRAMLTLLPTLVFSAGRIVVDGLAWMRERDAEQTGAVSS